MYYIVSPCRMVKSSWVASLGQQEMVVEATFLLVSAPLSPSLVKATMTYVLDVATAL